MKPGDKIKIEGSNFEILKIYFGYIENAEQAFRYAAWWLRQSQITTLETIKRLIPELANYEITVNYQTGIVTILGNQNDKIPESVLDALEKIRSE